ncbi:hypothetical protein [Aeromicrobium sp. UC242_57]|uniref:hypothetical protein n=1 Tax=Aeromicrobium sp. UC242_57 TaxID=3374624 RepID=UPI003798F038
MATEAQPAQLTDIASSLRSRWPVLILGALLGLGLGVLASYAIPAKYDATTTVSVNPMNAGPLAASADAAKSVSMPTEAGLATSRKVATAASEALAPRYVISPATITDSTSVTSPDDSLILNISYSGTTAAQAAAGADAVAEAYLQTRRTQAADSVTRLATAARNQIAAIQVQAKRPVNASAISQRTLQVQADSLAVKLADLNNLDLNPGQVVGSAVVPTKPSTPGIVPMGAAGLVIGLFAAIPFALLRRKQEDPEIGSVESIHSIGDSIVLDGTKDTHRADTWDIAAFMLKIPKQIGPDAPFTIMVDAEESPGRDITPGQELVDALQRRGRPARFVDASAINEGKISRGWPTDKKRFSWGGEIVIIDTTNLSSDANKVALATRSDSLLLARTTADDAAALRRFSSLLKSKSVDIALTALFPAPEQALHR